MEENKLYMPRLRQYTCMYLQGRGKTMKKISHLIIQVSQLRHELVTF